MLLSRRAAPLLSHHRFYTTMSKFPRVQVSEHGGADKLVFEADGGDAEALKAGLKENEMVVANEYAGVNFIDTYFRTGLYPAQPPFTNGQEGAGKVVAAGDASMVGKRVAFWNSQSGGYAGMVRLTKETMYEIPDGLDTKAAAASLLQGLTCHYLCHDCYPVKEGDWVLIHAAAGGCGLLLSQMCKMKGANVIGVCGSSAKVELARTVGRCDHVINYKEMDFAAEVRKIVPDGVHVAFDGVGKATFEGSLSSLRRRGFMVTFGNASGPVPPVSPLDLCKRGSISLVRPTLKDYICTPEERAKRTQDLSNWLVKGDLKLTISKVYPLSEARQAHEDLEGAKSTGKLLLQI